MRKSVQVVIPESGGRDAGKLYVLQEMPASQSEKWAARVWLALARSGSNFQVSEEDARSGLAGVAVAIMKAGVNLFSHMHWHDAEPLLDEMWQCVKIMPTPSNPAVIRDIIPDTAGGSDIEEIATRILLRKELLNLHVDFSEAVARLKSIWATATKNT